MNSLEKDLKKIFTVFFKINEKNIKLSSNIKDIKRWDSLNHVKLITVIEKKFKISIDPNEILKFVSFGQILKYLKKNLTGIRNK